MNGSISFHQSNPSPTLWSPQLDTPPFATTATFMYIAIGVATVSTLVHISLSRNIEHTRKFFENFILTPTKLGTFLLLGRAPLHYFGYLNRFPLVNVLGVAGFGGLGLSMIYIFQRRFLPTSGANAFSVAEVDGRRKVIELDWALQEEMALQLVCEIYHTVAGIVMGVLLMRLFEICTIDHKHLDLLMTAGLFGPTISFLLVIVLAVIVFGILWCLHKSCSWWHSRTTI